jgi:L-fuculose-phosphate aldolase
MITAIGDVMREAYTRGWITTRDGNISVKMRGRKTLYITPSGWRKTIIHPEHVVKLRYEDNTKLIVRKNNASGELHMHHLIQSGTLSTTSVVHLHPTYTIAAMHAGYDLQQVAKDFPEISRYTKVGPTVPIIPPITEELGLATAEAIGTREGEDSIKYDIVGQKAHGVCAVGRNPWDAFEHIERLEHICQIVLASGKR